MPARLPADAPTRRALAGEDPPAEGWFTAGATASTWFPGVAPGDRRDLLLIEQAIGLGRFGVLTSLRLSREASAVRHLANGAECRHHGGFDARSPNRRPCTVTQRTAAYLDPRRSLDARVADLLGRMTTDEKLQQIRYLGGAAVGLDEGRAYTADGLPADLRKALADGAGHLFYRIRTRDAAAVTAANCNAMQAVIRRDSRLKIPLLTATEALQGVMIDDATATPAPIALASSWNPHLVRDLYTMIALELRSRGIHMAYAPVLDVAGEPRWGRVQETYGEDPHLAGDLAVACVKGFQGDGETVDDRHVAACAKHFAGYGDTMGGRNFAPCSLTERELLSRHYPPFRRAIDQAGLLGVMAGHHDLDGVPCHANRHLLTEVLREQWGFEGLVVSDANDIGRLVALHRIVETREDAAAVALDAGVDLDITGNKCYDLLGDLLEVGRISEALIDRTVKRILYVKFKLGLFEQPFVETARAAELASCDDHQAVSRRAAGESVVLLRNDRGLLPLAAEAGTRLALIGPLARRTELGSYRPPFVESVSVYDALSERCAREGMELLFAEGCRIVEADGGNPVLVSDEANADALREAGETAAAADVVVLCVGDLGATCREAAYAGDQRGDRDNLDPAGSQMALLDTCLRAGTPGVVLTFNGRPVTFGAHLERIDALCCCWFLGQQTGRAVADLLFGDITPSGKLPMTFPKTVGQLPLRYDLPRAATHRQYLFTGNAPAFPFGYGLSYTTFAVSPPEPADETIGPGERTTVSVTVTNTGDRAGAEVVQLYVHDEIASTVRGLVELKGFERVDLQPGESKRVTFTVGPEQLGYWKSGLEYVVEPGAFRLLVGTCSDRSLPEANTARLTVTG
ncbi:MAG: glycoside hydrolase family 3 N-terminal domain-containing protein [Planctomycetota bacterium]